MSEITIDERADRIAGLIEKRLRVRGRGLETKLRRAGRQIPKWVRQEAETLVEAQQFSASPKLRKLVDPGRIDQAYARCYARCEKWLKSVDPWERRKDRILGFLAVNVFNLGVVAVGLLLTLRLTGHL